MRGFSSGKLDKSLESSGTLYLELLESGGALYLEMLKSVLKLK